MLLAKARAGNTKGGSITVALTSCLTSRFCKLKKIVSCHTADSKPVKQEVTGTVMLLPLVFPALALARSINYDRKVRYKLKYILTKVKHLQHQPLWYILLF